MRLNALGSTIDSLTDGTGSTGLIVKDIVAAQSPSGRIDTLASSISAS